MSIKRLFTLGRSLGMLLSNFFVINCDPSIRVNPFLPKSNTYRFYSVKLRLHEQFLLVLVMRFFQTLSCVFEMQTATGSDLFSLSTCLQSTTFIVLSIFSPLEMISIKIKETPLSWHVKCSLPVAAHVSKTCVLELPIHMCSHP